MANCTLAVELAATKESLNLQVAKTDELTAKLSKLCVRNVNNKLQCCDNEIVSPMRGINLKLSFRNLK